MVEEQQQPTESGERLGSIDPALSMRLTIITLLIGIPVSLFSGGVLLVNISVCAALTLIVWRHGPDVVKPIIALREPLREAVALIPRRNLEQISRRKEVQVVSPLEEEEKLLPAPTTMTRKLDEEEDAFLPPLPSKTTRPGDEEKSELGVYKKTVAPSTFSQVLMTFTPTLAAIYLGMLIDGTAIYSDAKGLCHVALGGSTGQGKGGLIRLLMAQLCAAGAAVLLLNPHYTRYDIERDEDWTPYEPYLLHPPMECRHYEAIEFYLKQVATVLLPKRLEKFAYSQPVGKPYFLVLDELPAIIDSVPDAPLYIGKILREGRKVGIFLIAASQDFLVKTISPQGGGGAVRDCYRTSYYVGGDPTTARVLLDLPPAQIQEHLLGPGTVMLRSQTCKQASLAKVPKVDNQALYDLLGPSTYIPGEEGSDDQDELILEHLSPSSLDTSVLAPSLYVKPQQTAVKEISTTKVLTQSLIPGRVIPKLKPELQMVLNVYKPGMSHREIEHAIKSTYGQKVSHVTAGKHLQRLKDLHIIDVDGNLLVNR